MNNLPESVPNPFATDFTRREFVKSSSFAAAMSMLGGIPLLAQEKKEAAPAPGGIEDQGNPVKCAVIGCNIWGREILNMLARFPKADVVGVCDKYEASLKRAKEAAPKAEAYSDYKKVLE